MCIRTASHNIIHTCTLIHAYSHHLQKIWVFRHSNSPQLYFVFCLLILVTGCDVTHKPNSVFGIVMSHNNGTQLEGRRIIKATQLIRKKAYILICINYMFRPTVAIIRFITDLRGSHISGWGY